MGKERQGIYWGWYVVLGAFLIQGISYSARYSFGVFVKPMALDNQWSRSVISTGISLMILAYGVGGIFAGRLVDRIAPRWIITAGATLMALGVMLTALVSSPWQYYLCYGVLGGLGSSCLGVVVCNSSVGKWFIRKRGLAIGISTIGIGVGTMAMAPLAGHMVSVYGWQAGFVMTGAAVLLVGVVLSQWLMGRTRPEDYGLRPDGSETRGGEGEAGPALAGGPRVPPSLKSVLADPRFWIMAVCYSLAVMAEMSSLIHQVAYAQDLKIDRLAAASALGVVGMASIGGRFFFGWLSDRLGDAKYAACSGFALLAAGTVLLLLTDSVPLLFAYAVVFGFGYGSLSTTLPYLVADRFGLYVMGSAYGMLTFFATGIGGSAGPLIAGYIYDLTGSYAWAWGLNLAVLAFVACLILFLRPAAGRNGVPKGC
jgi:sugar phosphate permease